MANEAICIEAPKLIVRRTVADANAIPKGTILVLSDPNTGAASAADNDIFGGITVEEKTALDGITEIGVAMDGVFDLTSTNAGITIGGIVVIGGANLIRAAIAADLLLGRVVGKAEELCAGTEVMRVRIGGN